jgi:hypothetical protein
MMQEQIIRPSNPYSEQGVSKYPPILPIVGQPDVYRRLEEMIEAMREETGSCFRTIYGDWGIGKTRLAHELVAEACGQSRGWIVKLTGDDGKRRTLLDFMGSGGVLPVYTNFADIIQTPDIGIDISSALSKAVCVALASLAQASGRDYQVRMASDLQSAIRSINPIFDFEELAYRTRNQKLSLVERANQAFKFIQQHTQKAGKITVQKLLIIVDEVETAGEFTPANTAEERRVQEFPVEALDIKALFTAVKTEAGQSTLPNISFLFLCSPGVRRVAYIEASARRVKDATLEKATGEDLRLFLNALESESYFVDYPGDLPRAAFLAADRNFGWYSYIMHPVHRLTQDSDGQKYDYEILKEVSERIGKVFKPQLIEGLNIDPELKDYLSRVVYHQVPTTLDQLEIPESALSKLLEFTDPYNLKIVGEIFTARLDGDTLIRELLKNPDYKEETATSTRLIGEGSAPFDPRELLRCFSTYEGSQPNTFMLFAAPSEFASQLRFLVPDDLSERTIATLHSIFEKNKLTDQPLMVAPTVAFLLKFNDRWASAGVRTWLSDQTWELLDRKIKELNTTQVRQRICRGIAKVLIESGRITLQSLSQVKNPSTAWKLSDSDPFSLTREGRLGVIYAVDTNTLIRDLSEINKKPFPVLVIFPSEERLKDLQETLAAMHRHELSRIIIPRIVSTGSREHEFLIRYSYRDENDGYQASEVRENGREHRREYEREWQNAQESWLVRLEEQGYLLRPIVPTNGKYLDLRTAYGLLAKGLNKDQIATQENGSSLRQAIDNAVMNLPNESLPIFADPNGKLNFPNVFARVLNLLSDPLTVDQLANRIFYLRTSLGGFNSPKSITVVVEQLLGLLEEIGLVEKENGHYSAMDEHRLGTLLTRAINQLGDFGSSPSNYVENVRNLTEPFKQLAFKLQINEEQLKLIHNTLRNSQDKLPGLDLNAAKETPAHQDAFLKVAGVVREIRHSIDKVFRENANQQLPIDPATVTQNLQNIAADHDYSIYSIEQRITFLNSLQEKVESQRQELKQLIRQIQDRIQGVLCININGSEFPITPIDRLLDITLKDLEIQDLTLPEELKTEEIDAELKTYMMAGEMDKALRRLHRYNVWFDKDEADSYYSKFCRLHDRWQDVIAEAKVLGESWENLIAYFDGDPDRDRWISADLESGYEQAIKYIQNFGSEFSITYSLPSLDDLDAEIQATSEQIVNLSTEIEQAVSGGKEEIHQQIETTTYPGLCRLANRLDQPTRASDNIVWSEVKHIDQHTKVKELDENSKRRGAELLGNRNWFMKYIQIFRDINSEADVRAIYEKYGHDTLQVLAEKNALTFEQRVFIEL